MRTPIIIERALQMCYKSGKMLISVLKNMQKARRSQLAPPCYAAFYSVYSVITYSGISITADPISVTVNPNTSKYPGSAGSRDF